MYSIENLELTQINNDTNDNPRYVVHFLTFIKDSDIKIGEEHKSTYHIALKRAKTIGGKKYHTKSFGGGIVFQAVNTHKLKQQIIDLVNNLV